MIYAIHSPRRSAVIVQGNKITACIVDLEANHTVYPQGEVSIDALICLLESHTVPIPRGFREQLISDSKLDPKDGTIHYHFDRSGKEIFRRNLSQRVG